MVTRLQMIKIALEFAKNGSDFDIFNREWILNTENQVYKITSKTMVTWLQYLKGSRCSSLDGGDLLVID